MRSLFITCWYPSSKSTGFGIFVKEHAAAVQQAGIKTAVIALLHNPSKALLSIRRELFTDENGVLTLLVHIEGRLHKWAASTPWFLYRQINTAFLQLVKSGFKPDILHGNVIFPAGVLTNFLSRKYYIPYVLTEHWSRADAFINNHIWSSLGKRAYAEAKAVSCVSGFLAAKISPLLPPNVLFSIIPNVVHADVFTYKPKPIPEPGAPVELFAAMTLCLPKRPELLIEAVALVQRQTGIRFRLTLAGSGPLKDHLEGLASENSVNLNLVGQVSKPELGKLLQASVFCVHASNFETFGVVPAEALSTGTPVVCSNLPALQEMLQTGDGLLCENTPESWALAITEAANTAWDNKAIALRNEGRYSSKGIGLLFKDLYFKALAGTET